MRISDNWIGYELLDAANGERLERWGDVILIRPDPQIIWKTRVRLPSGERRTRVISVRIRVEEHGIIVASSPKAGRYATVNLRLW